MGNVKIEAAHYRTWQFVEPLVTDGHDILLCAGTRDEAIDRVPDKTGYRFVPVRFGAKDSNWTREMQKAHDSFKPDCVIAVNFSHCLYATKLCTDKPFWMDIYGDMLTIQQATMYRAKSNRGLRTTIAFMRDTLQKGDVFSGCSEPQKHMLVGELAMAGRLDRNTFGYELVHVIPPGASLKSTEDNASQAQTSKNKTRQRALLSKLGAELNEKDFVVLWCGGYNTWTDTRLLFDALELAMAHAPHLHFVSVGANTYDAPDNVYAQLLERVSQSPYKDRYHMLGWRPWTEMAQFYNESDVGVNLDAMHYETIYGTRTRLVEMMSAGLPVVSSEGTEIIKDIVKNEAGLVFPSGDAKHFGECLVRIATNTSLRNHMAERALRLATGKLSFNVTLDLVRAWVQNPQHAPDHIQANKDRFLKRVEFRMRSVVRHADWVFRNVDR
jgi:glycosyltransferase involved in cell wall biosynthesis